ncbi:hypothetical protein [Mycoplana dimorpha]|uniref:Uncharacterized protein n=1 Tax=Mycoplana dimorpha TaxID=28320 RepID=A0A2T5B0X4_MYCDI|nr:hypothetical protein [Mycoplana dimorpha]PTM92631.1 hypothetical protein C7449_10744 [Mycoplana dimorpha]
MFIDDEKSARDHRRREGRAVLYITATALAACVLMVLGLLNVANAMPIDASVAILQGDIGETHLVLDVRDAVQREEPLAVTVFQEVAGDAPVDPVTTASTATDDAASIDRRLGAALTLAALVALAGLAQMAGRRIDPAPARAAPWRSEA